MGDQLTESLRSLVRQYGFRKVSQSLDEIQFPNEGDRGPVVGEASMRRVAKPRRVKPTASRCVARLDLPFEKSAPITELAQRFDDKAFLPSSGDIAHFCTSYSIEQPSSKSRAGAIPRVFRAIAAMEVEEIQRLVDNRMFSGPSRLGPIADAIRNRSKAGATAFLGDKLD